MAANKPFGDEVNSLGSALDIFVITASDATELANAIRMLYVGTAGDVSVTTTRGSTVTHKNVSAGSYLGPFSVVKVNATGTTALDLIGYI